jgi:hypothetical protein
VAVADVAKVSQLGPHLRGFELDWNLSDELGMGTHDRPFDGDELQVFNRQ